MHDCRSSRFAGSSIIGNKVIGGQAGISGHLKIGNNVKIGGVGVVKDIEDNQIVMGYPVVFSPILKDKKMSESEIDKKLRVCYLIGNLCCF